MSAEVKTHYYERRIGQIVADYEKQLADNFAHLQELALTHKQELERMQAAHAEELERLAEQVRSAERPDTEASETPSG